MSRIFHVNGNLVPEAEAVIPVLDRGFIFADGIYEVTAVLDGRMIDNDAHLDRLDRCLGELGIPNPHDRAGWVALQEALIRANALAEGLVYIEVTRGVADRDFAPPPGLVPTVVMFTQTKRLADPPAAKTGIDVALVPDLRWARRDIKSVALLAQVMAKREAAAKGCAEAWMVDGDGTVTEGGSSTAFIVADGAIVTRGLSRRLLPGITRRAVLELCRREGLAFVERAFTPEEALAASEAFITSASSFVMPVVRIDDRPIGDGAPGPVAAKLRALYLDLARGGNA